jgi:hypothetical protein
MIAALAINAPEILAARMKGLKPADMVIVSLVGPVGAENPTVFAKPEAVYDWRWVRDLDVCVYLNEEQDWADLLKAIALQRPAHLNLWSRTGQWGAKVYLVPTAADISKPVRSWKYELDFMPWMDFQNGDFACTL